jgi:hypothetical protein
MSERDPVALKDRSSGEGGTVVNRIRSRPDIPVRPCMYADCRIANATTVDIDGNHPRDLCEYHAARVRYAWERREAYVVQWGRTPEDRRASIQRRVDDLLAQYGQPDRDAVSKARGHRDEVFDYVSIHGDIPPGHPLRNVPPDDPRMDGWLQIDELCAEMEHAGGGLPVVRIEPAIVGS